MRKRVLIVEDDTVWLSRLRKVFPGQESDWEVVFVEGGETAHKLLEARPFDVIVCGAHLPGLTGVQLLNEAGQRQPHAIRFILADPADRESTSKAIAGTHQFLAKPCEPETIKFHIHRALTLEQWLGHESVRNLVARIGTLPPIPPLYLELLKELNLPTASAQRIGDIVSKDLLMTVKLQQLINSAYFGLSRQITTPAEAAAILGFGTVKSLVLFYQVLAHFEKVKSAHYLVDRLWHHSTAVAQAARAISHTEGAGLAAQEESFMAGLFHDVGKLLLVSSFSEQYQGARTLARKNNLALWDVERDLFGACHCEVGAYLIGQWGLPLAVAEAAALHHAPLLPETQSFKPLTAVHVANVFVQSDRPDPDGLPVPALHIEYLAKLNLTERLPVWRNVLTARTGSTPKPESGPSGTVVIAKSSVQTGLQTPTHSPTPAALKPSPVVSSEPAKSYEPVGEETDLLPESRPRSVPYLLAILGALLVWILWPQRGTVPVPKNTDTQETAGTNDLSLGESNAPEDSSVVSKPLGESPSSADQTNQTSSLPASAPSNNGPAP
jgi:putative nucleotidyltransferase with HDIG domain